MGYSTDYAGEIRIANLNLDRVRTLQKYFGEDKRDLDPVPKVDFYHFNIELNDELTALKWDGSEKTSYLEQMLNFLKEAAGLEFQEGDQILAQGEEATDRYLITIENNTAVTKTIQVGGFVHCPECDHRFIPGEAEE